MGRKYLAAAFYSPHRFGLDEFGVGDTGGALADVKTHVMQLDDHTCAIVRFSQYDFLDLTEDGEGGPSLASDPALPFAHLFRETAARVGCEVAFLVTHLHQADSDWLEGRYWMVQARDADSLAAETFGLTHFDDGMVLDWATPRLNERNILPGGPGLTFFAGVGRARWF